MGVLTGAMTFGWCALLAGLMARLVTLSGRRITYIAPVDVRTKVGLQSAAVVFGPIVGVAGAIALVVDATTSSALTAWLVAVALVALLSVPGSRGARRLFINDLSRTWARREARHPEDSQG